MGFNSVAKGLTDKGGVNRGLEETTQWEASKLVSIGKSWTAKNSVDGVWKGSHIFQKSNKHLQLLGGRTVTRNKPTYWGPSFRSNLYTSLFDRCRWIETYFCMSGQKKKKIIIQKIFDSTIQNLQSPGRPRARNLCNPGAMSKSWLKFWTCPPSQAIRKARAFPVLDLS
jgi:hypothetical protein